MEQAVIIFPEQGTCLFQERFGDVILPERHDYTDVSDNYSANTQQDTSVAITASGTRAFPADGYGNVAVVPGVYSIAAYDYNDGAKQVSNLIEITVV